MLEFAKFIKDLTHSASEIVHKPMPTDDPTRRRPDITRAKTYLGWAPKVKVVDGLERSIEYFRGELANSVARDKQSRHGAGPYNKIDLPGLV